MRSISWSLSAGTMGAAITDTGMPASASARIASSRLGGVEARGSMVRASVRSSVVTDRATFTSPLPAMRDRMSMSRVTSADLVTMSTGWLCASSTSRISRMMRHCFSTGW